MTSLPASIVRDRTARVRSCAGACALSTLGCGHPAKMNGRVDGTSAGASDWVYTRAAILGFAANADAPGGNPLLFAQREPSRRPPRDAHGPGQRLDHLALEHQRPRSAERRNDVSTHRSAPRHDRRGRRRALDANDLRLRRRERRGLRAHDARSQRALSVHEQPRDSPHRSHSASLIATGRRSRPPRRTSSCGPRAVALR